MGGHTVAGKEPPSWASPWSGGESDSCGSSWSRDWVTVDAAGDALAGIELRARVFYIDELRELERDRPSVDAGPEPSARSTWPYFHIGVIDVTIDKSLRVRRGALRNRNVLTHVERIAKLMETDRWNEGDSILGLPKVRVQKISLKKKKKSKKDEDEDKK